jgi:hypothetical protein
VSASTSSAVSPRTEVAARPRLPAWPRTRSPALSRRKLRALTLLAGIAASLPVLLTAVRALAQGWVPLADQGTIATRAYEVFGAHTPLLGQYSFASRAVGHVTYDPGPMLYWLLAVPARLGGPAAITVVMAAFNTAAIMGSVALARRRGGLPLMLMSAFALALMSRSFGSEALHGIWNPAVALFPLALLCFLSWSVACGEHRLLALGAAVASFVIQCHLAYAAPVLALVAVGLVGLALRQRGAPPSARRPLVRSLLLTGVVVLACWSAPLVDQVEHTPGNLSLLASAATASHTSEGANVGWRALAHAVGLPPRLTQAPTRSLAGQGPAAGALSGGDYGDTRLDDVTHGPSALAALSCALALLGLLALALVSLRRLRADIAIGAAIGLVLSGAFAWTASATPVQDFPTLGYTLWWGSLVGMWVWLLLLWGGGVLLLPAAGWTRWSSERASALAYGGCGAVLLCGALVAAGEPADAHQPEFAPARSVADALTREVPGGARAALAEHGLAVVPLVPALRYELERRGVHLLAQTLHYTPSPATAVPAPAGDRLVIAVAEDSAPPPGAVVVARLRLPLAPWLPGAATRHTVTVTLSEPPALGATHSPAPRRRPSRA